MERQLTNCIEPSTTVAATIPTRNVHFLSIDQVNENHFASAGPPGENVVSVWDRRFAVKASENAVSGSSEANPVLEIRPAVDPASQANIWSLRFNPFRRGAFAVLSSSGQVRFFETSALPSHFDFYDSPNTTGSSTDLSSLLYTRQSCDLYSAPRPEVLEEDIVSRVIAFDFASPPNSRKPDRLLSIRQNRAVEISHVPSRSPRIEMSSSNNLAVNVSGKITVLQQKEGDSIADDLITIQAESLRHSSGDTITQDDITASIEHMNVANQRSRIFGDMTHKSSLERHNEFHSLHTHKNLSAQDMMTIADVQRRRCLEGYLFDCEKNQEIVRNDPWLVDLWKIINRMTHMASNSGLSFKGLDFSYLGVYDVWRANLTPAQDRIGRRSNPSRKECSNGIATLLASKGYGKFEGVKTDFPGLRQLGLAICDWKFDDKRLLEKCVEILGRRDYYKAIAVAVCHGSRTIAMDLLKRLTRAKALEVSGLAAVIACETVSEEQRSLCDWMAEEAEDPYLKAILAYFVSGDWNSMVTMDELPLVYRVAVALKYLDDKRLDEFLRDATHHAIENGDTEGVCLTGLGESSIELFQTYIARYNDLQTAVIATAFANPGYVHDERWDLWKESYYSQMQSWAAFTERAHFTSQHNRMSSGRKTRKVEENKHLLSVRCSHCQKPITKDAVTVQESSDESSVAASTSTLATQLKAPAASTVGITCQYCKSRFSRCSVCVMWQGRELLTIATSAEVEKEYAFAGFIGFCVACNHGYHPTHAREWFAEHRLCPVPDCRCTCAAGYADF